MDEVKKNYEKEKRIAAEITDLSNDIKEAKSDAEKRMLSSQIVSLKSSLKETAEKVMDSVEDVSVPKPLTPDFVDEPIKSKAPIPQVKSREYMPVDQGKLKAMGLEKFALQRMNKKPVVVVRKKERKPNIYVKMASQMFYHRTLEMVKRGKFFSLRRDLIKANMEFIPANYIAMMYFATLVAFVASIFIMLFFLFFSLIALPPFIIPTETPFGLRFLQVIWIIFALPAVVFSLAYFYPSMEQKSIEGRINQELPFATIHMSSISRSMIEPSKIFSIIIVTQEYAFLEREFIKLLNEVNIYGYDLVTALRNIAFNSPSRKLADLYNGLATTINSGGNLPEFFDKRAQTLLFEHRIEREKQGKAAETFLDIYISVVIAAPMILMLLLMMMRISGLGLSLSTGMITLVMVLGVSLMNILFLAFLQIKQPEGGA